MNLADRVPVAPQALSGPLALLDTRAPGVILGPLVHLDRRVMGSSHSKGRKEKRGTWGSRASRGTPGLLFRNQGVQASPTTSQGRREIEDPGEIKVKKASAFPISKA